MIEKKRMSEYRSVEVTQNDHNAVVAGLEMTRGTKATDKQRTPVVLKRPNGTVTSDGGYDEGDAVQAFLDDPANQNTR